MSIFSPTKVHTGLVEFRTASGSGFTPTDYVDDEFFEFSIVDRTFPSDVSLAFDASLPNGLVSNIDIKIKPAVGIYLGASFSGLSVKKIGLMVERSGYPDDTAPNECVLVKDSGVYIPMSMKRIITGTTVDFMVLPFVQDSSTALFKLRDHTKWSTMADYPIICHGYYGWFSILKIAFAFSIPTIGSSFFWTNTVRCVEDAEEVIIGETEIPDPPTYKIICNVNSSGVDYFRDEVYDPTYFSTRSESTSSTYQSITLNGTPCFKCLLGDYIVGGQETITSLEYNAFVLCMRIAFENTSDRVEIMGNTYGVDGCGFGTFGGFAIMMRSGKIYFSRYDKNTYSGGVTKSAYIATSVFPNTFFDLEISVDESGVFRLFVNGVKKIEESGMPSFYMQEDSVYIGKRGRCEQTYAPLYINALAISRDTKLIHKENYTVMGTPYSQPA